MIQLCKFFLFYLLISIDFHTFSLRNPLKIDPMDNILFWLVPVASVLALCFAYYFHKQMMKEGEGTPQMIKIAAAVRKGAMSYLKQQYKIVGWVFLGLVILFSIMAYGFHTECLGSHCFPYRWILLRAFRIFGDEDGNIRVRSYR
jgi:K(+)-stimulated pyrophosphate-energized sodium pump